MPLALSVFMIGRVLSGYQVLDKIREGSVGTVWRAQDATGRIVALKQLALGQSGDERSQALFRREARRTGELHHPRIIRMERYVGAHPQPFFVMEYFESENLKYSLRRLPERVAGREFSILRQLAEALAHVHRRGIVHRDVKPENVLLSETGEIRLIDFSLAQTKWERWFTFRRRVEGTPNYMSPEQIRGGRVDVRSDLYSLGVVTYEVLTGRLPFPASSPAAIFQKHLSERVPSLGGGLGGSMAEMDEFLQRLLAKRPEERPASADAAAYHFAKWERRGVRGPSAIRSQSTFSTARVAPAM